MTAFSQTLRILQCFHVGILFIFAIWEIVYDKIARLHSEIEAWR